LPNQQGNHSLIDAKRVVVAMSGGVDSSVAAALLVERGYDVIGIMLRLWSDTTGTGSTFSNRCCTPNQMADARRVAEQLKIPFHVIDAQEIFHKTIVQSYIEQHHAGLTPNPCIACNRKIRFTYLYQHAMALNAHYLATGHYARVRNNNGQYELTRGRDRQKDQSYVLHVLDQEKLPHVLFPVGEYTKDEVRRLARRFELPVAAKSESQDLCFILDGDNKGFLRRHSQQNINGGPILDRAGNTLGEHEGLAFYTIGQRKGLGISANQPLYVLEKQQDQNALVVGPRVALEQTQFLVQDVNWISGVPIAPEDEVEIKIRYKAASVEGNVIREDQKMYLVKLKAPVMGVTSGQGAVFYDGDICLGGGIITARANMAEENTKES
jgi:tRNA-uridine 2-sulfurtransferase